MGRKKDELLLDKVNKQLRKICSKSKKHKPKSEGDPIGKSHKATGEGDVERSNVIEKAGEFVSSDLTSGGALNDEQQDRFIRTVIENSQLLARVRKPRMTAPSRKIERIGMTSRFLKPATEITAPSSSTKPSVAKITLDTYEYIGLVTISYDTLQDSIEGGRNVRGNPIEQTIREIVGLAVARDIEYYALLSDTASGDSDLTKFDGILKLASNSYSHGSASVSKALYKGTLLSLPKKFRQDKSMLEFFHGPSTDTEWRDELADRGTGLGDRALSDSDNADERFGAYGIATNQVTQLPETLGGSSDEGKLLLANPQNLVVGVWREVFFDWDKVVETRELKLAVTVRFGFKYEDPDGAAIGKDYKVA